MNADETVPSDVLSAVGTAGGVLSAPDDDSSLIDAFFSLIASSLLPDPADTPSWLLNLPFLRVIFFLLIPLVLLLSGVLFPMISPKSLRLMHFILEYLPHLVYILFTCTCHPITHILHILINLNMIHLSYPANVVSDIVTKPNCDAMSSATNTNIIHYRGITNMVWYL